MFQAREGLCNLTTERKIIDGAKSLKGQLMKSRHSYVDEHFHEGLT